MDRTESQNGFDPGSEELSKTTTKIDLITKKGTKPI